MPNTRPNLPSVAATDGGGSASATPISTASPKSKQTSCQNWTACKSANHAKRGASARGVVTSEEGPGDTDECIGKSSQNNAQLPGRQSCGPQGPYTKLPPIIAQNSRSGEPEARSISPLTGYAIVHSSFAHCCQTTSLPFSQQQFVNLLQPGSGR